MSERILNRKSPIANHQSTMVNHQSKINNGPSLVILKEYDPYDR